ncbi:hypothetical protein GCM10022225_50080 [Plantactinospora mayteni]|uniref:Uncharacterized protein n=1 Tax=Plantactinospora mayteni TaxID=566021 RepID=A0ABQ4EXZ7_9ACTN|nr:hypothetical protein [Plantactinospora mayteni]GIG99506.1 hypothetical protein Pma05_60790 [Plantactinospora mayteni]
MPDDHGVPVDAPAAPAAPDPTPETAPVEPARLSRWRRIGPVVALWLLAPWAAECAWGGFTVEDYPLVVLFLGPLYGSAALLIRETARRAGGGWPAIVLLGAAFGTIQAGLVDQSLFNDAFLDDTEFAETAAAARATMVPWLGFSAQNALGYVGGHVVLSVCVPIVLVESFVGPARRRQPWLGRVGLVLAGALYLLGSLLIFSDDGGRKEFLASPLQLSFAALTALALVTAALLPRWRRGRRPVDPVGGSDDTRTGAAVEAAASRAPHPLWAGLVVCGARLAVDLVPNWAGVAIGVLASAFAAVVVVRWSRRTGWGQRHVLAAWGAGLVVAAAGAYLAPSYSAASPTQALVADLTVSLLTLALLGGAFWRLRAERSGSAAPLPRGRSAG